jgi:hypothetical protein
MRWELRSQWYNRDYPMAVEDIVDGAAMAVEVAIEVMEVMVVVEDAPIATMAIAAEVTVAIDVVAAAMAVTTKAVAVDLMEVMAANTGAATEPAATITLLAIIATSMATLAAHPLKEKKNMAVMSSGYTNRF